MQPILQEFVTHLYVEQKSAVLTVDGYRRDVNKFLEFIDFKKLENLNGIGPKTITDFLYELNQKGISQRSIARNLAGVKRFFKYLLTENLISQNPTENIESPRYLQKLPNLLSIDQVNQLLETPDTSTPLGYRDRTMLETLYATGMRVSELVQSKLHEFHWDGGYFLITGKGDKQRVVPVGEVAKEWIATYLKEQRPRLSKGQESDHLFITKRGDGMTRQEFWKIMKKKREDGRIEPSGESPFPSALFRNTPSPTGRGSPIGSTNAGSCRYIYNSNIYPRS